LAHYLFNFTAGDRQRSRGLLRSKTWRVGRYRDALAPGDLALIYVSTHFIGRAELATVVRDGEVSLSWVEEWDPAGPMDAVVRRIDPTGSNPYVQENAASGFQSDVVQITADEYEAAVALSRETWR
jgi:hypothetical protein